MPDTKVQISLSIGGWIFWIVVVGALGYFAYGHTMDGFFGGIVIGFITGFAIAVGLVPIFGPILYWFWLFPALRAFSLSITGLGMNWFTDLIMWIGLLFAVILTLPTSFFTLMLIRDHFD